MAPRDLLERTRLFALEVVRFCRLLPSTDEAQEAAEQLRRAANAVRLNYRAARRGRSYAEFKAKEAEELARIFAAAVKTARRNSSRLKKFRDS